MRTFAFISSGKTFSSTLSTFSTSRTVFTTFAIMTFCTLLIICTLLISTTVALASDPHNGTVTRRVVRPNAITPASAPPQQRQKSSSSQGTKIILQGQLMRWVNGILNRIKPHLERVDDKGVDFRIRIIDDPTVNAMTLADGRIYITKGLLKFVKSDDELASVIAHECGHVEMHHHEKRGLKQTLWTGLAMLGAAMTKADGTGFLAAQLLGNLATMSYSRNQEHEADRVGVAYCEAAGYNPTASVDFIKRLLKKEEVLKKKGGYRPSPIFNTHPPSHARAVKVADQLEGLGPFPPKVLSYNPGRLFYAPMDWSQRPSIQTTEPGPLHGKQSLFIYDNFEHKSSNGWNISKNGAFRIVNDKVAIGSKTMKIWASGKGVTEFITSEVTIPESFINGVFESGVIEFIGTGPMSFKVSVIVKLYTESDTVVTVRLPAQISGEQENWRLFRVSDFSPVVKAAEKLRNNDNFKLHSFAVGWLFPDKARGAMWVDELRFGVTSKFRLLDNTNLSGLSTSGLNNKGSDVQFEGWEVLRGSGKTVDSADKDKIIAGKQHFEVSPPAGGRYATIVSAPVDLSRINGGYMLYFYSRANQGVRLFAGLEILNSKKEWKPAGSVDINKNWKRLRLISDEKPVNNDVCRIRFEFSSTTKDFTVLLDEIILVSLLKGENK